uniref:Ribosomal protein L2 n=1 Tax=Babesia gibsoni TaxID=33632 RepID=A0A6M8NTN5_BABGI|nr:ribosomal protein L2 [Babesia gibsoni]
MIIFNIKYNKKIGRNKGKITVRHKKSPQNNFYIPIDINYFNYIYNKNLYFILYNTELNNTFKNTKLILSLCIKGSMKGEYRYILKPYKKNYGDFIKFYNTDKKTTGDTNILKNFFIGNKLYNIQYYKYTKFKLCIAALSYAVLISFTNSKVILKLPSNKLIYLNIYSYASYNFAEKINLIKYKKAGYNILLGKKSKVRGSAMNACDHPHGGGEGKSPIGRKTSYSFVGRKCKGIKTVHKIK